VILCTGDPELDIDAKRLVSAPLICIQKQKIENGFVMGNIYKRFKKYYHQFVKNMKIQQESPSAFDR